MSCFSIADPLIEDAQQCRELFDTIVRETESTLVDNLATLERLLVLSRPAAMQYARHNGTRRNEALVDAALMHDTLGRLLDEGTRLSEAMRALEPLFTSVYQTTLRGIARNTEPITEFISAQQPFPPDQCDIIRSLLVLMERCGMAAPDTHLLVRLQAKPPPMLSPLGPVLEGFLVGNLIVAINTTPERTATTTTTTTTTTVAVSDVSPTPLPTSLTFPAYAVNNPFSLGSEATTTTSDKE